jgi:hypothetical protein
MDVSQQFSAVILSASALCVLLWMILIGFASIRLDEFRQRMFAIRDGLFDYARSGNIGFDQPAYKLLRKSMNGFIRYGHRLSFFQLVITFCRWHYTDDQPVFSWRAQWEDALSKVSDEKVRKDLMKIQAESMGVVFGRVILGSPVLMVAMAGIGIALLCRDGWKSTRDFRRVSAEKTFKLFSIDTDRLEDEALRVAA